ncbi:MAG TPA: hypothetical protein VH302_00120 [Bryobacteraceae bacterium]|nr:hypothetical protein [Bryobacteraceae bacterium]
MLPNLVAQTTVNAPGATGTKQQAPPIAGLETPWDAAKIVAAVEQSNEKLRPAISKLNPQKWYDDKGAPSTYIVQWQTAQQEVNDIATTTKLLQQKVDSLAAALDVYFRLEALDVTARSLNEGAQRYADRATADQLTQLLAENFNDRERFREYIKDLAASTEQNFKIADEEAQRCRTALSQETPVKKAKKK